MSSIRDSGNDLPAAKATALHSFVFGIGLLFAAPALAVTTGSWTNAAGNTNRANAAGIVATISGSLGATTCLAGVVAGYGVENLNNTADAASWFANPYGNPVAGLPDLLLTTCYGPNNSAKTVTFTFSKPVDNPVLHVDRLGGSRRPADDPNTYATSSWWRLTGSSSSGGSVALQRLAGNPHLFVGPAEFVRSVIYTDGTPIYADNASECGTAITRGTACGSIRMAGTGITSLTFSVTGTAWGNVLNTDDGDGLEMAWSVKGSTIAIRKQTTGGFGAFGFLDDNTTTADTGTSASSGSTTLTTSAASNPVTSGQYRVGDHARAIVLTETPAAGFALQSATCLDQAGAAVAATRSGSALTIDAASYRANQDVVCTFVNAKTSRVTLTKNWVVGAPDETVNLSIGGGSNAVPGSSTPASTTDATATGTTGATITLNEVFATPANAGNYVSSLSCPGVTVSPAADGRSGTFTMPGADVTCTFTNTRRPNLAVTKTSNASPAWVIGQSGAQYVLSVTNRGGTATSGTVTVADALPAEVSANWTDPLTTNGWSCTRTGQSVTCRTTASIAAGASSQIVLPVNVIAEGDATNYASAGGGGDPFNGGVAPAPAAGCADASHCARHVTRVNTPASIITAKALTGVNDQPAQAGTSVKAGDVLTYTITSRNSGQTAGTTTLTETVPANATYTGPDGAAWAGCSVGAAAGTSCTATQNVAAAGEASTTFTVTVATPVSVEAATLTNSVTSSADPVCAACAVGNPVVKPRLEVTKQATPNPFLAGQPASYVITVANRGEAPTAATLTISDTLPAGVTLTSASGSGWSCTGTSALSCVYTGTLEAGADTVLTLEVSVAASAANADNTATASGGGDAGCPSAARCSGTVPVPVNPSADIVLDKTVDNAAPNVGETVTFTITASNDGPSDATGVAVTDALPAGLTFVSAALSQGSYEETTGLWTIGALANGAQATLTLIAEVRTTGASSNTATKSAGDQFDPDTSNNAATASVNAQPSADLQVGKNASTAAPNLGANVSFTITVRNAGPNDATGVVIDDLLPAGLTFVSASASVGSYDAATGVWTLGDLADDAQATLTIVATVGMPGELTNTAVVAASDQHDPNPANDSGGVTINGQAADIQVLKTVDEASPTRGATVTFTVTVTNLGPSAASGVRIEESLPTGLTFVSAVPSRGSYDDASGLWTIGDLAASGADAVATLTVTAAADTDARVTNSARLEGLDQTDPDPNNNQAEASVTPIASADLSVAKSGPASVTPGRNVAYAIVVNNAGPSPAAQVSLDDPTPAGLSFVSADAPCAGGFPCALGDLAAGASVTVNATFAVPSNYAGADPIANTATVSSPTGDPDTDNNTSTATTPVVRSADVSVTKTGPATVTAAGTITYTLVVSNAGPSDADGTSVGDPLPAGLSNASASCAGETGGAVCGAFDTTVAGTITTLPAGGSATITITATAPNDATTLTNTASVTPPTGVTDPVPGNNQSTVGTTVEASANLSMTKSGPATVTSGGAISYTLVIANTGPSAANGATYSDAVPAGITDVAASCGAAAGGAVCANPNVAGNTVSGTVPTLPANGSVTITITGTAPIGAQMLTNTASVVPPAGTTDPDPSDDTDTATTRVAPAADIAVTKTVDEAEPNVGERLTFTVAATNEGPDDATGVEITDGLPLGLTFVSATASQGDYDQTTGLWRVGALANGANARLTITATVTRPGAIVNTATRTGGDQLDPVSGNNAGSAGVNAGSLADLQVDKTVDQAAPNVGAHVTYTVTLRNAGPSPATAVNVTDVLPAGLGFVSATPSVGAYDETTGRWTVGDLAAGAEQTLTIVATVTQAGEITNTATGAAAEADPDPSNNGDGVTINGQSADIQVVKTVDDTAPRVGDTVTYTVTMTNNGPSAATNVTATDALPSGLTFVSATPSQGSYDEVTGRWTIGDLAASGAGSSATLTLAATVNAGQAGTTIANVAASAGGDQIDPNPANDEDRVEIVPQGQADVSVMKSGPASATAGANVTFAIVVNNAGPSTAAQVSLADPTPPGLSLVSADAPCAAGFPCALGDLAAGASVTVNVTYAVPPDYAGADPIVNTATVSSPTDDPDADNNRSTATTPVVRSADVRIAKSAPATVAAAGTITYTIAVSNAGPSDADGTTVSDPLPAGLTDADVTCGSETGGTACGAFDTTVAGTITALPAGGSATITITATAPHAATSLSNTATATSPPGVTDPDTANNRDTADTQVVAAPRSADLAVTKTGPASAAAGAEVTYTLRVANAGPDAADAVVLDDPTPAGLTFASAGAPCAAGFPCALGDLAAGAEVEVTVTFAVPPTASGTIVNTATVSSPTPDPDPRDDTSTVHTPIVPVAPETADLAVAKSGPAGASAGETVTYTIVVSNRGPSDVPDAVLDDPTPTGLRFVSATAPCESGFPCVLGTLANGASASVTAVYAVQARAGGSIANTASASSPSVRDPTPDNNSSTATTVVGGQPAPAMPVPMDARWMLALMGLVLSLGAAGRLRRR